MKDKALIASTSKSLSAILSAQLSDYDIESKAVETGSGVLEILKSQTPLNLLFLNLEIVKEISRDLVVAIKEVRGYYSGPFYILTSSSDLSSYKSLIEEGVTDIVNVTDMALLKGIINAYTLYKDIVFSDKPFNALLVEDSATQRQVITEVLKRHNVQVSDVPTVREAMQVLAFEPIDIVITDIHLSGDMTGMQLVREICQNAQWRGIPTVVISGVVPDNRVREYFQLGIRDFIFKPLDLELFSLKITNILRERLTYLQLKQKTEQLNRLAYTDALTGLHNRAHLKEHFESWSENNGWQFYAIMLDLDNLKPINDEYGHDAGDQAICNVANCLNDYLEEGEIAIRLGGDEFVALIHANDQSLAVERTTQLLAKINSIPGPLNRGLAASIGITRIEKETTLSNVLKLCDALMYVAKSSGKNVVETDF